MERIIATYHIETPIAPEDAAAILAGEQSSGTFVAVPGETEELKRRFAARVESVERTGTVTAPSMPGTSSPNGTFHRATVRVSWSIEQFGTNLPMMVSTLQGNLYEIRAFTGLRLIDIDLPTSYGTHFRGPAYGIAGCRELTATHNRPLIGTIIKPSVGMTAAETATIVDTLAGAGIDFIKDDELMSSTATTGCRDGCTGATCRSHRKDGHVRLQHQWRDG
jgi:ribulose-bisphosphate carboxylase large chain